MYAFLMQDWITIRAAASFNVVNQSENCYLDLSGFQDLVVWTEVKGITSGGGTPTIMYQTAPTKDDSFFVPFGVEGGGVSSVGVAILPLIMSSNNTTTPLSRWLRWQMQNAGSSIWDMTFRIFVCANTGGRGARALPGMPNAPSARAGWPASSGASGSIRTGGRAGLFTGPPPAIRTGVQAGSRSVPLHLSHPVQGSATAHGLARTGGPSVPLHQKPVVPR
jgi:hypothetical protein